VRVEVEPGGLAETFEPQFEGHHLLGMGGREPDQLVDVVGQGRTVSLDAGPADGSEGRVRPATSAER